MVNIKPKLLYFNNWLKGHAVDILDNYSDIDLVNLNFADKHDICDDTLSEFTGYQIMPRTELDPHFLLNKVLIDKMDNLLAVCSTGSGYDMIDVVACTEAGIIVCNQAGTNKEAVAEHVFGLILALSKNIIKANQDMRSIDLLGRETLTGNDIFGKTLGIIGIGHIGTRVAEIAKAFRLNVLSFDP
jgi:D-3-phosphoglycerate dehydrogenase